MAVADDGVNVDVSDEDVMESVGGADDSVGVVSESVDGV